jgi:hypothetical protein
MPTKLKPQKSVSHKLKYWQIILIIVVVVLFAVAIGLTIYLNRSSNQPIKNSNEVVVVPPEEEYSPPAALTFDSKFAKYEEVPVNINSQVAAYSTDANFSNVTNIKDIEKDYFPDGAVWTAKTKQLLAQNLFAITPYGDSEFFRIYENDRYNYTPNFITTDSILHNYHLMFDYTLRRLEEDKLAPELKKLNVAMLASALGQYNSLKGTEWGNAAKRNVGFFAVASKLLDPAVAIPEIIKSEVEGELALIEAHEGIKESLVMNIGSKAGVKIETPQGALSPDAVNEDYSQYIPRGHYTKSEELKAYFKSMMWYGRLTFRFKSEDEVRSAVLMTLSLDKKTNFDSWNKIYEPINFFVGKTNDISYYDFKNAIDWLLGAGEKPEIILTDKNKLAMFVSRLANMNPPQINSIPIFQASIQPDREKEIKGFRFMGQRFTIDAAIFQRLITREVGPKGLACSKAPFNDGRMLPKGLDIPAAMGSKKAEGILKSQGDFELACYPENMSKMQKYIASLGVDIWTQNLYWGWLYSLQSLTTEKPAGYPSFMINSAWAGKDLNTYLASWTELKHDTILYAKQVYAELGGGGELPAKKDDRGYVEPNVLVYARLASLLKMTAAGLADRGLLSAANKTNLGKLEQLALSLKTISEKELNNTALTDAEYELIRSYGGQLESFWLEVNKNDMAASGLDQRNYLDQNPSALVADVATDPNGQVLEEGTGRVNSIFVIVPIDGKLTIARGAVYSYYEFPWPLSDRLTDEKWRELLQNYDQPQLPSWTNEFIVK